ncbi:hypothetical protein [Halorussus salinus]|uniref:hypothetical protein n=1 Tax=Halorussus salinus TaxID=1364935 RepID=UPI0010931EC9|nr:hypothetical protein [Halorussus salinus]
MAGLADRIGLADSRAEERLADRSRLGGASLVVVAAALVLLYGAPGVAAAAAVVACWLALPATYAFALGTVALAALAGESVAEIALVEVGLVGLLVAPAGLLDRPARPVGIAVVAVAAGGALAWATSHGAIGLPLAGLVVLGGTALGGYALHRYQLVNIGLAGDASE